MAQVKALLGLVGDVQQHQSSHVELARALGHHELDSLPLMKRLAERIALGDVLCRQVQGPLRHRDVAHSVAKAPICQPVLSHIETVALSTQEVFGRHDQVLDVDLTVAMADDMGKYFSLILAAKENLSDYLSVQVNQTSRTRSYPSKETIFTRMFRGEEIEGFSKSFDNGRMRIYKLELTAAV